MGIFTLNQWIPALSTGALGLLVWLVKNRLSKGVKHEYDLKLEEIKSELAKNLEKSKSEQAENLEKIKSELAGNRSDLEAIRNIALTNISDNQRLVFARQIEAIESIWDCVLKLAPAKGISYTLNIIPYDKVIVNAEESSQVRDYFKQIAPDDISSIPKRGFALVNRPFVSQLAWAYYSAYEAVLYHAMFRMETLKRGINITNVPIRDDSDVVDLLKLALPDKSDYIENYRSSCFHSLLNEIENRLLNEFRHMLSGQEVDSESIRRAAEITKQSTDIMNNINND